ncbi:MAG: DDE-type integrase/transposase/recombinase [Hyphomicrobium sp.]|uniref:IS1 family transposase n=1 Tax=Hyphomicrobium sp. TaxID=82 RepID=UPI0039E6E079
MNKLPIAKRVQILSMLCEGSSMRSVSRVCDVSINTVAKLLADAGTFCAAFHDERVRNLTSKRVQCDEIWSFVYAKNKNVVDAKAPPKGAGDVWTWTAIDADTKLICSWAVGQRDAYWAAAFLDDLKGRLATRVQLTTDGHKAYLTAVESVFGGTDIDFAQLVKIYGDVRGNAEERRYSPPDCIGVKKMPIVGNPDEAHISTSYVERQNLTMRMSMKRFTRLSNAFSKKLASHRHALALYFTFYNWTRIHKTLRVTPAMAAGISDRLWTMEEIIGLMDEAAPKPGRPKTYKKRIAA